MHTEDLTSLNATIGRQTARIEALEEMIEFGPQKQPVKIMDIKTEALTRTQFAEAETDIIEPNDKGETR
jgi:hypothetical protein